jgi:hypothetical protein
LAAVKRLVCFLVGHAYLPGSRYCWRCKSGERITDPINRAYL